MGIAVRAHRFRTTPELLKDLRTLRVAVFHPRDHDGEQLTRQLQRIGCQVQAFWPPVPDLPAPFDIVFLAVKPETINLDLPWSKGDDAPTVIAVVNYENPTIVDAVLRLCASAVVAAPIRSFGVLSSLILARQLTAQLRQQRRRIEKLESKLAFMRKISEAKTIVMHTKGISEDEAYAVMREQAMSKRVPIEEIATAIMNANEILAMGKKSG
jgi:AmiR/NasT family two-component response regulator